MESKRVIISPYSRAMRNNKLNPKNYPVKYWTEFVSILKSNDVHVIQIGTSGETKIDGVDEIMISLPLSELKKLVESCDTWISVDNFFPHLCNLVGKFGVVVFGQSDPLIFGHINNENILKDRKYLRTKQFDIWEACEYNDEAFVEPSIVADCVLRRIHGSNLRNT